MKLASENAFAGDPGTKPISLEGAKALAMAHAEGDLPKKGEGFEVLETTTGKQRPGKRQREGNSRRQAKTQYEEGEGRKETKGELIFCTFGYLGVLVCCIIIMAETGEEGVGSLTSRCYELDVRSVPTGGNWDEN